MAVTGVVRCILVVHVVILGLYHVLSEEPMILSSLTRSKVIRICKNNRWQQYQVSPDGDIQFFTVDSKRRILYWITNKSFFSVALDGNKKIVNLSKKFRKGLVFQVHDGQIIFAAANWGLMKFDVDKNRKLFSVKASDITKYQPNLTLMNIDASGTDTCLYWNGPNIQISKYFINSNINQILVPRPPYSWIPSIVYEQKIYWFDFTLRLFTTDMNLKNKTFWNILRMGDAFVILRGIMYYSSSRLTSPKSLKTKYPFKPYSISCPYNNYKNFNVILVPNITTDIHQTVKEHRNQDVLPDVEDDEEDVKGHGDNGDDTVVEETSVWSTIGWIIGGVATLFLLMMVCYRLFIMARRYLDKSHPNLDNTGNVHTVSENIYTDNL